MHQLGYVGKRPRYVLQPDPERDKRMHEIRKKVANLDESTAILFLDETDLLLFPPLRSTWAKRGTPVRVSLSGGKHAGLH